MSCVAENGDGCHGCLLSSTAVPKLRGHVPRIGCGPLHAALGTHDG